MYELTNLTINENDLINAIVMMERYGQIIYNGEMETKRPEYYQTLKAIEEVWMKMETDKEYTLAVRL